MKKIFIVLIIFCNLSNAQSPAGIWYFGQKAGLNFNTGPNPISINDGELETDEGCATLCDGNGNLLFYTDGITVWNRNHLEMPNGNGLKGDPSSTQSAIIVPKPGSTTLYYVFTVDELGKPNGMNYSIIDINLDGGLGDITTKNISLFTPSLEKITAVKHSNETSIWIIGHRYNSDSFVAYELSSAGIQITPVTSSAGSIISNNTIKSIGYMKSSPNGQYIACANAGDASNVQLFSFNNTTGTLNLISTSAIDFNGLGSYGVEFSSNSELLYISRIDYTNKLSEIFQFNIVSQNETIINNSKTLISSHNYTTNEFIGLYASLQLGPDQKIYIARNNSFYLSAINNPNIVGLGCQFVENAVTLQNKCKYGLPSFVTSYLELNYTVQNFCLGNNTKFNAPGFSAAIAYDWDFDDPSSGTNTSNDINPTHVFSAVGNYVVTLTVTTTTTTSIFTKLVSIIDAPIANPVTSINKCDDNNNGTAIFNLNDKNGEVLGNQNASNYIIKYYPSLNDALSNVNQLPSAFTNNSNPQTIYVKIETTDGVCYDTTSFDLIINNLPKLGDDITAYYCKNLFPNTISLSTENQNSNEFLTYLWSNGATTESIDINQSGIYTVTATNSNNCVATRTITILNSEIATITSIFQGQIGDYNVVINTTGAGNYSYSLDQELGPYQSSSIFNNVSPGEHIIYVKDEHECGIINEDFSVLGYPKFFTPNNDGYNDYWKLIGEKIVINSLKIFDRYGKLIQDVTLKNGWDGKYNGINALATDYWFIAELDSGEKVRGHFSLIR